MARDKQSGLVYQHQSTTQQQQYLVGIDANGVGGSGDGINVGGSNITPTSGLTGTTLLSGGLLPLSSIHHHHHPHHHSHHSHHHHHHLQHSQFGSTPANSSRVSPLCGNQESNLETEEEELLLHNKQHPLHQQQYPIGSEGEDEAPFAFRRKQGCDYLRVIVIMRLAQLVRECMLSIFNSNSIYIF